MTDPNRFSSDEPFDLDQPALRDRAVFAATGKAPFDLLLSGGNLVNVATSEIYAADVGIVGGLVASVHPAGTRQDAAETIDCTNRFVTPGLIDAHMHIESSMVTPRRYAEVVVPQGTTTAVWDPHEVGNVAGLDGVRWTIDAARGLDLRVLSLAPSCVPSAPGIERAGAEFNAPEMELMLSWPDIHGVAEIMDMRGVLSRSPRMAGIVQAGLASGKMVCGHARGLLGPDVQGFASAGIQSDHEITGAEDFLDKIRAGFTIELRGSHDYVLPHVVAALKSLPHMPQTLTLCTDDVFPDDLVEKGGMADVLRRLVGYGLDPVDALRAATLNSAMRLGRRDLGLVAPGRRADIAVLSDLRDFRATEVFASGRLVARDGAPIAPQAAAARETAFTNTVRLAPFKAGDFDFPAKGSSVRVNTVVTPRFTRWGTAELPVRNGIVDVPPDVLRMAVVHRHGRALGVPVVGLLEDWGCWKGAIATTIAHDSHNLNVFGSDPVDMAVAANALIDAGGGMAVAQGGKLLALLALPVCGLLSDLPVSEVGTALRALREAADRVADWKPPVRTFKALVGASLACNPGPHVTDIGICDGLSGEIRHTLVC